MEHDAAAALDQRKHALRKVLLRQKLRLWASKARQERAEFAEGLVQLFTSSALSSAASTASENGLSLANRPITRRPGVEEVRNCILASEYPCVPPECAALRGEIWQVLLNVYKRNQHGAAAQEFERMIMRLSKLPRDPQLVEECEAVSRLLCEEDEEKRARVQNELEILLVWFLTTKSVTYVSGMARVVAVFFSLGLPLPTVYDCFYQYCASFLPHFVNNTATTTTYTGVTSGMTKLSTTDGSEYESTQHEDSESTLLEDVADPREEEDKRKRRNRQQLVEQLLSYHDPQLAHFLNQWCPNGWSEPGDLVPQQLFFGELYTVVAPKAFVYVMDQLLLTSDSMFSVFLLIAVLIGSRDELLALRSGADVITKVKELFQTQVNDPSRMQFFSMFASGLRNRTPKTYQCAQEEAKDTFCASRRATDMAFDESAARSKNATKDDVDMSEWQKRESRSFAGKVFWYHLPTGRTQWEHPAEEFEPAPASFALPVGVEEVARQVMGEKRSTGSSNSSSDRSGPRFFVVDLRGIRSSEDLKSGRIPAAYTLDPSVFDSPELIERSMAALNPMKSCVHIVLVGNGVGLPPDLIKNEEMKTSIRDAVRHDTDGINRAALFFQKRGFRYISCLDGGYSSWHAFMRDDPSCSPNELLAHVEDECHYCRYDTILRTGEDPLKKKKTTKTRRKKAPMPTTTTMLVNGGEGDSSIVSTNAAAQPNPPATSRRSLTSSLSLSRPSLTNGMNMGSLSSMNMSTISSMRSKLSDVKMPKLSWRRANTSNQNDSSSETATAEDGGSDRGSSTADEMESRPLESEDDAESAVASGAISPKIEEKAFVGVFTIDYSDDEDEQLEVPPAKESATATTA
ncbi:hypothetical protein Poli38472_011546 [Pythium oligandrum]|uniref:TBC1 domain family member 23 n=1 Tax=Pythium oligandrum TaxID=41045 RepID=A0A8K1FJ90_PYTOL|nr:hypothetical protein Poli38472_011546 [Pythium oligandrum]|eukprot:TMW64666.1 hypothetical protein Poli38472_011546 [Pythium oligandrum]